MFFFFLLFIIRVYSAITFQCFSVLPSLCPSRPALPLSMSTRLCFVPVFPCLPCPYPPLHILSLSTLLSLVPIHFFILFPSTFLSLLPVHPPRPFPCLSIYPLSLSIHLSLVPIYPTIPCPYPPFPPFSLPTHPSIPSPRPSSSASRLRQLKQRHKWRPVINVSRPRFNTSAASPVLVRGSGAAVYYLREPRSLKAHDKPGSRSPQA